MFWRNKCVKVWLSLQQLFLPISDQAAALRELAFSVFTKIRRLSFTVPISSITRSTSQSSNNSNPLGSPPLLSPTSSTSGLSSIPRQEQQLYEPAFVLAQPPPLFVVGSGNSSSSENILHCCYTPSDDLSCILLYLPFPFVLCSTFW